MSGSNVLMAKVFSFAVSMVLSTVAMNLKMKEMRAPTEVNEGKYVVLAVNEVDGQ